LEKEKEREGREGLNGERIRARDCKEGDWRLDRNLIGGGGGGGEKKGDVDQPNS